jgi:hypothetical protein
VQRVVSGTNKGTGKVERRAHMFVIKIQATDLKSVDIRGTNDPYIELSFGTAWKLATTPIVSGGSHVEWTFEREDKSAHLVAPLDDLGGEDVLRVVVKDYNKYLAHTLIGEAGTSLQFVQSITTVYPQNRFGNTLVWAALSHGRLVLYGRRSDEQQASRSPLFIAALDEAQVRSSLTQPMFEVRFKDLRGKENTVSLWARRKADVADWIRVLTGGVGGGSLALNSSPLNYGASLSRTVSRVASFRKS